MLSTIIIDEYLAQPSGEKLPSAVDENKHRGPLLDFIQRERPGNTQS